jgi:hypothetical protein
LGENEGQRGNQTMSKANIIKADLRGLWPRRKGE